MTAAKHYVLALRRAPQPPAVDALAAQTGLHPELVARLIALGALDTGASPGAYPADAAARLARLMRLRRDLGVNVAGALLALDLLARIDELESRLPRHRPRR